MTEHPTPPSLRFLPIVPCVLFLAIGALCLNDTMMYSPDSVNYLSWARSLARLQGFSDTLGPEPSRYVFNAPFYPLMLAPLALFFPLGVGAAKILTMLTGTLMLAAFQAALARRTGAWPALGATLFLAVNPLLVLFATQVLSDIPFAACSVLVALLLERVTREDEIGLLLPFPLAVAATCALFLREVGIALVAATAVALLVRKRFIPLFVLFCVVAGSYGLWFIRNELIVARWENPGLRNLSLFVSHVYTASGTSPLAEAAARISRALRFYGPPLATLAVAPFRADWTFSVVDNTDPLLGAMESATGALVWPLAALTAIAVVWGAARILREGTHTAFLATLVPLYAAIIALYPVSDIRFLFPALLVIAWCAAEAAVPAARALNRMRPHSGTACSVLLLAVLSLPNLAWERNVVSTNIEYRRDPSGYVTSTAARDPYPGELLLIARPAAEWIDAHSPAGTVVGSKKKAAALWLGERPLLVLNPLTPIEDFDNKIRDYGVRYLVCELAGHQVPDFAFQMALSPRSRFVPVFTFGDIRVYSVEKKDRTGEPSLSPPPGGFGPTEGRFLGGVYALAAGDPRRALATFTQMESVPGVETSALFYAAVAQEFALDLDSAETMFAAFRTIPQSAAYLRQAQTHEDIIALLRSAEGHLSAEEAAGVFQDAAMSYWILGFRSQAARMLREALRLEPGYFAGDVFGSIFSLAGGDTAGAREGVRLALAARPDDPLTHALVTVVACIDSLPRSPHPGALELSIGRQYVAMGLYEMGIDQALKALGYGEDPDALRMLADLYLRKDRRAPALATLRRLTLLRPSDSELQQEIQNIETYLR